MKQSCDKHTDFRGKKKSHTNVYHIQYKSWDQLSKNKYRQCNQLIKKVQDHIKAFCSKNIFNQNYKTTHKHNTKNTRRGIAPTCGIAANRWFCMVVVLCSGIWHNNNFVWWCLAQWQSHVVAFSTMVVWKESNGLRKRGGSDGGMKEWVSHSMRMRKRICSRCLEWESGMCIGRGRKEIFGFKIEFQVE